MHLIRKMWLPITVFITGGCVLVIELTALRILSPYFGNTLYSASSVISVVLAALSFGYWFGGRLADRSKADARLFFMLIVASGLLVLAMHFLQSVLLPHMGYQLPIAFGSLVMSIILFFVPSFVLGLLSPFAVALQQKQSKGQGVGTTAGQIFFFSTLGSIAGSLATGFVLVPSFGVSSIIIGTGLVLCGLGVVALAILRAKPTTAVLVVLLCAGILLPSTPSTDTRKIVYARDGLYEKIVVFDSNLRTQPTRFLQQDTNNSAAMFLHSDELVYQYTRYYGLHRLFTPKVERALSIGGGAYSVPKALLQELPGVHVDASEIEPLLPEIAQKYFNLPDDPRLTHHITDGRRMLHDTPHRYDLIFSDVYQSMYSIPAHFTTKEFMQLARDRLTRQGVLIANLIGSLRSDRQSFIWAEVRTMQQIFPQVYVFAMQDPHTTDAQNIIVVGSMQPERADLSPATMVGRGDALLVEASRGYVDTTQRDLSGQHILTDDYAPVEHLVSQFLPNR